MSSQAIQQLIKRRDDRLAELDAYVEREDFDPTTDAEQVNAMRAAIDADQKQIEDLQSYMKVRAGFTTPDPASPRTRAEDLPLGEAFIRSPSYTDFSAGRSTGRRFTRALPTTLTDVADALTPPVKIDTSPLPETFPLLSVIPATVVSGNSVDYVTWSTVTGGAAKVAEGALKPSAEYAPTSTSATLDTIAVWTHLTRQLVEDAPAVRSTIEQLLAYDVRKAVSAEAAAVLAAATLPTAVNADLLTAIRIAKGTVEAAGFMPNVVVLNPADYAALDVAVMGTTVGGAPVTQATYWGLRPVASPDQVAGTAVVGDFTAGMAHYTRGNVDLYLSDSDADDFVKNLVKVLAEQRSKFVVTRADAFCETAAA